MLFEFVLLAYSFRLAGVSSRCHRISLLRDVPDVNRCVLVAVRVHLQWTSSSVAEGPSAASKETFEARTISGPQSWSLHGHPSVNTPSECNEHFSFQQQQQYVA